MLLGFFRDNANVPLETVVVSTELSRQVASKIRSYLNKVGWNIQLNGSRVLVAPSISEQGQTKLAGPVALEAHKTGYVCLLQDGEPWACHSRSNEALKKASCKTGWMDSTINLKLQDIDKLVRCLENSISLTDSDMFGLIPGELLEGTNETLERAFWAVSREGTLLLLVSYRYPRPKSQTVCRHLHARGFQHVSPSWLTLHRIGTPGTSDTEKQPAPG